MATLFDLSVDSAPESWRRIRALRAAPSEPLGSVLTGRRKQVFHASLEQAQQQFAAAPVVGYESRALNLFYGLSQAGRALAAASVRHHGTDWEGNAHGLKFRSSFPAKDALMQEVVVTPTAHDSFSRVSVALGSPTDLRAVSLAHLMSVLPEIFYRYGPIGDTMPLLESPTGYELLDFSEPGPYTLGMLADPFGRDSLTVDDVSAVYSRYPALSALPLPRSEDGVIPWSLNNPGQFDVLVAEAAHVAVRQSIHYLSGDQRYRGHEFLFPAAGASTEALHPLMAWWLLLYALSVLARYSPSSWLDLLNIRTSPISSMLEYTLDVAVESVPELIAAALDELNN